MEKIKELTRTSDFHDGDGYMFDVKTKICIIIEKEINPVNNEGKVLIREIKKGFGTVVLGNKKRIDVTHYEELYGEDGPITMMLSNGQKQYIVPRQYNSDESLPKIAFYYGRKEDALNFNKEIGLELDELVLRDKKPSFESFTLNEYRSFDDISCYSNFKTDTHQIWVF